MRRIQLGKPYEDFLEQMVKSGYYATATEVIRDALRVKMAELEDKEKSEVRALVLEGQAEIDRGMGIPYNDGLLEQVKLEGIKSAEEGVEVPSHLRP